MTVFMGNEAIKSYLLARVEQAPNPDGCWIWRGRRGYGVCMINGRMKRAARASYEAWVGPIPPGYDIHHRCNCRACIRPDHLEPILHAKHMDLHSQEGAWRGTRNSRSKLTDDGVRMILELGSHIYPQDLAACLGVSKRTIYHILAGKGWVHVTGKRAKIKPRSVVRMGESAANYYPPEQLLRLRAARNMRIPPSLL